MVQAILQGRKTQTRRGNGLDDVNDYPDDWESVTIGPLGYMTRKSAKGKYGATFMSKLGAISENTISICPAICPYGQPGDRLWVRETWQMNVPPSGVLYRADPVSAYDDGPWKSPIFMKRSDSRITLEVTGIRVERVQDISEEDAGFEGCSTHGLNLSVAPNGMLPCVALYRELWDSINGNWDKNPFVWVIEFKIL